MNEFKLLGRVGKLDMEYKDTGTVITKISLGVKNSKKEWENFWITFFNKKNYNTAEILGDTVKEGDYIRVEGKLIINKYTPQGADKPKFSMQLLGWGFKKVIFDEATRKYVDLEDPEYGVNKEIVKFGEPENIIGENEIPH